MRAPRRRRVVYLGRGGRRHGGGVCVAVEARTGALLTIAITPLILTFNEAPNLARTLSRLSWADDIVVVDSLSTDATAAIAAEHPRVRLVPHPFTSLAEQWNFGLEQTGITTDWVLALDADYYLTDALIEELQSLAPEPDVAGYRATFKYCINGQPLRGAAYPPVNVLFRRSLTHVEQDGHAQRARIRGPVRPLVGQILHDDRKSLTHWLSAQAGYMRLEVEKLSTRSPADLALLDRLRKLVVVAPLVMFVYCYVLRGGILDGKRGFYYALQRAAAELILSLFLVDRMLQPPGAPDQTA